MSLHPAVAAVRLAVRRALADVEAGHVGAWSPARAVPTRSRCWRRPSSRGAGPGWHVIGATVDHGLQEGSAAHADRLVAQMGRLGADETISATVHVEGAGLGPEAAARQARYAVLEEIAERFEAAVVALGHTRDDQAETVLMGLARGSGGRSLAGMRRSFDHLVRPLLDVSRADTVTACQVEGIDFWEDPHNVDPAYTRVRVRTRILPLLEDELGPGVAATLARTADQLRADMDLLDDVAQTAYAGLRGPPSSTACAGAARPRSGAGSSGWRRWRPAPRHPSSSTSTCSRWTRSSPTGTARSGSTSRVTCAARGSPAGSPWAPLTARVLRPESPQVRLRSADQGGTLVEAGSSRPGRT